MELMGRMGPIELWAKCAKGAKGAWGAWGECNAWGAWGSGGAPGHLLTTVHDHNVLLFMWFRQLLRQGMVDASKPALRQDTDHMVEKT